MVSGSTVLRAALLASALWLAGCGGGGGDGADSAPAVVPAPAPEAVPTPIPTPEPEVVAQACGKGGLVDAEFRDAALATLTQLSVQAPGKDAHGAIRAHLSPGHTDPDDQDWQFVAAYHANLAMAEALRVSPALAPRAADWLRWQARHTTGVGAGQGVVLDHWLRVGDLQESLCPPGRPAGSCPQVDSYDSTAASLLLMADAYRAAVPDAALLHESAVRTALQTAAATIAALTQAHGLTLAKPDYPVAYLMDAVEVAAGWRAWARVQQQVYADTIGAQASRAAAQRTEDAVRQQLWHVPSQAWRVDVEAGAPDFSRWYADTVAQAWPLLWDVRGPAASDAADAWRRAASRWQGANDWSQRNVDPDGFWWPSIAVAAHCAGDAAAARTWVARARSAWLQPGDPFPWPFQVSDLRWVFWMAEPRS
ncbi:hypothetical protein [Pseudorhodoferax sp. Leaf267]|uniref:hypothetical protein n=1 Tax=Pseudorhodoferax sp. Leaf267 TaxID=1736316 RepID=UPI000714A88A|nr:hypothetical protein [Pseudorhodoferax sp. Leaf267]KQP14052.1 hypothetical protein ASF43_14480 [Pseudorhodoferax sp. Leaf267]